MMIILADFVADFIAEINYDDVRDNCKDPALTDLCTYAAGGKRLDVLKWARSHNYAWDEKTCAYAAYFGDLRALKWARANGCPWDSSVYSYAVQTGQLDC